MCRELMYDILIWIYDTFRFVFCYILLHTRQLSWYYVLSQRNNMGTNEHIVEQMVKKPYDFNTFD